MRTVIELANSNCTWCRDAMIDHPITRPLVRQVLVDSTTGCLVVDHDHDSPAALIAEVRDDLRGWVLAEDGEKVRRRTEDGKRQRRGGDDATKARVASPPAQLRAE
jgi:hypothetical protein